MAALQEHGIPFLLPFGETPGPTLSLRSRSGSRAFNAKTGRLRGGEGNRLSRSD